MGSEMCIRDRFMLLRYSAHPRDGIKLSERLWVKVWYPGNLGIALLKHRLLKHQVARIGFNPIGLRSPIGLVVRHQNSILWNGGQGIYYIQKVLCAWHREYMHHSCIRGVATFALGGFRGAIPISKVHVGKAIRLDCLRWILTSRRQPNRSF